MKNLDNSNLILTEQQINKIRSFLFSEPRELSGSIQSAFEATLEKHEGDNSSSIVENWYRGAGVANYNNEAAAAAYLGAYGARSILKYQEALFSLFIIKGFIPKEIVILDYGSGPCPGFAALLDLWVLLSQVSDQQLLLKYIAVDRSAFMIKIGETFCNSLKTNIIDSVEVSFELLLESDFKEKEIDIDILILSNVLNEGEGHSDCSTILNYVIQKLLRIEDIIVIEPATEHSSRQMCSLTRNFKNLNHIGPCPSANVNCAEWTFREFRKRVYGFERRCAGPLAAATNICKYSLSLLSYVTNPRTINDDESVIIRRLQASNKVLTCKNGEKQWLVTYNGLPWDLINKKRVITKKFP